jgi:hypothetical protein
MATVVRAGLVILGFGIMLGGIVFMTAVPEAAPAALWWIVIGGFFVVIVALERQRYRSEAAERTKAPPGPGGGETPDVAIEPRFLPTAEAFIDPTSGHRMRVLVDPGTGERRYVAEA